MSLDFRQASNSLDVSRGEVGQRGPHLFQVMGLVDVEKRELLWVIVRNVLFLDVADAHFFKSVADAILV